MLTRLIAVLATLLITGASQAAYKTQTIKDKAPRFKMEIKYPQTGNAAIDSDIKAFAKEIADGYSVLKKSAPYSELLKFHNASFTGDLDFEVVRDDDQIFSVKFSWFTGTPEAEGGVIKRYFGRNYQKSTGRQILIAELLGQEGLQSLSKLVPPLLKEKLPDDNYDAKLVATGTAPYESNYEAYLWRADDLQFIFGAGQVASFFAHTQAVEIPIKDIKPLMRADPLAPLASFDCAKAKTAIEKEICADWKLARADRFLHTVYGDKLREITDAPQIEPFKQAQRKWVKERDDSCGKLAADALRKCLSQKINARTDELKPSLAGLG